MQTSILTNGDGSGSVTVFADGDIKVAHSDHPNFSRILRGAVENDESILSLFDASQTVAEKFDGLSERVSVSNGRIYFDNDEVDTAVTQEIVRFLNADEADWIPLVHFFEKVQQNPNQHSREMLFDWLRDREFTITKDGDIIGYKGLGSNMNSLATGKAVVNGKVVNGVIPNQIGSVIEMPRSEVQHDPANGCSVGLHAGTHVFAQNYGRGTVISMTINPRDVVSVPTDCNAEKMRVSRYKVKEVVSEPYSGLVVADDEAPSYEDEYSVDLDPDSEYWQD